MATNLATALPSPRERLLEAAAELFAKHGYQAIGLRDLASHLGLLRNWTPWVVAATPSLLYLLMSLSVSRGIGKRFVQHVQLQRTLFANLLKF